MVNAISRRSVLATGALGAASALVAPAAKAAPTEIVWWHAMSGALGERLVELTARFNASQSACAVTPMFKGTYDELINGTVAAYRTRTNPHIVQIYERGFMTMLLSGAIVPVHDLMAEQKFTIDWADFIKPIAAYYTYKGHLVSMPFNSSSPILFYNKALFAKAGIDKPADTWQGLEQQLRQVKKATGIGNILADDYQWSWIENYCAINDFQYATRRNGFDGLDAEFVYNRTPLVRQIERMKRWLDEGLLSIAGPGSVATSVFTSGQSATFIASTAAHGAMFAAKDLEWNAVMLPWEEDRAPPHNSVIGGATLWVLKGHEADARHTASFLAYLARPEVQVWWHESTGYVPATNAAYKLAREEGWYKKYPTQELAVAQLSRGTPTDNTLGFRIGSNTQTLLAQREEVERYFGGQKTAQQALDDAVSRSNEILRRFERLNAGRY